MEIICDVWERPSCSGFGGKLKEIARLKEWDKQEFGLIDQNIASLEDVIHEFDMASNSRNLSVDELAERRETQLNMWT